MRRPWIIVVTSFAVVMAVGGMALAVPAVLDRAEPEPAAASEAPVPTSAVEKPAVAEEAPAKEVEEKPVAVEVKKAVDDEPKDEKVVEEPKEEPKAEPPFLKITWPENGEHVDDKTIRFTGVTDPGAAVFAGKYEADVDADGTWGIVLVLQPGGNLASFKAVNDTEKVAEASVKVFYDAPVKEETKDETKKDETKDEAVKYEFWAKQKYGFCAETPPYDKFYGGTQPGAAVTVSSAYGSGETVAGEKGGWELKVVFADAPPNEPFLVTVTSAGLSKTFEFKYKVEAEHGGEDK